MWTWCFVATLDRMLRPSRMQVTVSISCRATRPMVPSVQDYSTRRVKGESREATVYGLSSMVRPVFYVVDQGRDQRTPVHIGQNYTHGILAGTGSEEYTKTESAEKWSELKKMGISGARWECEKGREGGYEGFQAFCPKGGPSGRQTILILSNSLCCQPLQRYCTCNGSVKSMFGQTEQSRNRQEPDSVTDRSICSNIYLQLWSAVVSWSRWAKEGTNKTGLIQKMSY